MSISNNKAKKKKKKRFYVCDFFPVTLFPPKSVAFFRDFFPVTFFFLHSSMLAVLGNRQSSTRGIPKACLGLIMRVLLLLMKKIYYCFRHKINDRDFPISVKNSIFF